MKVNSHNWAKKGIKVVRFGSLNRTNGNVEVTVGDQTYNVPNPEPELLG